MDALLEPPSDFSLRVPVVTRAAGTYYRVHQSRYGALYFDRAPSYRFNAPAGEYGILYMSEAPEGAFAEALLGGRSRPPTLSQGALQSRALTELGWRELVLADFTGLGLTALGLDARISSSDCYPLCQRWASWIHAHPLKVDGICYFARNAPHLRSVALFDRAGMPRATTMLEPTLLVRPGLLAPWGRKFVSAFDVAIV